MRQYRKREENPPTFALRRLHSSQAFEVYLRFGWLAARSVDGWGIAAKMTDGGGDSSWPVRVCKGVITESVERSGARGESGIQIPLVATREESSNEISPFCPSPWLVSVV
ncbi:hypothetical protein CCHR01_07698 [Colletotrichum chrysophilum]|uniref:Uncharacterized protein n=1 Tax=Colletotrichum chrysophilum TaxID=1836956 RepID=A0AAD9AKI5_9PEZI|nr:hypothetical protein CCHR01_07698 [Colletotrichum chrysophilum]